VNLSGLMTALSPKAELAAIERQIEEDEFRSAAWAREIPKVRERLRTLEEDTRRVQGRLIKLHRRRDVLRATNKEGCTA
jgi:septal ring factor EnvC (AmiA/AmiB activator)